MEVDTEPVSGWLNFCWGLLSLCSLQIKKMGWTLPGN